MINSSDSVNSIIAQLRSTSRFNEAECQQIALQAKIGHANFQRFEESRKAESYKLIDEAARQLNFV